MAALLERRTDPQAILLGLEAGEHGREKRRVVPWLRRWETGNKSSCERLLVGIFPLSLNVACGPHLKTIVPHLLKSHERVT